ncbi:MAG: hypothetical protein ACOCV1_05095 [Bacillota bacterium]
MKIRKQEYIDIYENYLKEIVKVKPEFVEKIFTIEHPGPRTKLNHKGLTPYPYFHKRMEIYKEYHKPIYNMFNAIINYRDISCTVTESLKDIFFHYINSVREKIFSQREKQYLNHEIKGSVGTEYKRPAFLQYCNEHFLRSNGSSKSENQEYVWGPTYIMRDLMYIIEQLFYMDYSSEYLHHYQMIKSPIKELIYGGGIFYRFQLKLLSPEDIFEFNLQDIKNSDKIIIETDPFSLQLLSKNNKFKEFAISKGVVFGITDYSPDEFNFSELEHENIKIVNKMRNWKEGTSFYTCPYGNKHWTENLFYCTKHKRVLDLYNIYNDWWEESSNSDAIWPLETTFKQCNCGCYYREINFEPHCINSFKDKNGDFINLVGLKVYNLNKKYKFIQIVQTKDRNIFNIHVWPKEINEKDFNKIKSYIIHNYKSDNVKIEIKNYPYKVGNRNKRPTFWSEA